MSYIIATYVFNPEIKGRVTGNQTVTDLTIVNLDTIPKLESIR